MGRIGLAFKVLLNSAFARDVAKLAKPEPEKIEQKPAKVEPPAPVRSEAVTLLATLQREARLLDFFQEPIADYQDAQIGAAVRDVHRLTNEVLERVFEVRPLLTDAEGTTVELPANADAAKYKLTGALSGNASKGELMHHGWQASKCDLPVWNGSADTALVVAPAEVEVKGS